MPTTDSPHHSSPDLSAELRDMWHTRPVRSPDDRKIAGVCGGIARRYGVDPVLARVAFVVAAFCGGAGVFFYSLAWLLLRRPGDEVGPLQSLFGRGRSGTSKAFTLLLAFVAFVSMPTFGGSDSAFVGASILATIAMLAGWYGLYRHTPVPPAGWEEFPVPAADAFDRGPAADGATDRTPPRWDPLGAAPFAWDLPDPGSAPGPAPKRPKSRLTPVTLGIALIAAAVSTGLASLAGVSFLTAPRIGAISLGVIGVGLLMGSVLRRGHGLLVVAGPLAGFILLTAMVPASHDGNGPWNGNPDLAVTLSDPVQLDTPIVHQVGKVDVDMSDLVLDRDRTMSISNQVGEVRVILPPDLDTRVTCATDVGSTTCPSGLDTGRDGPSGPVLTLDVRNDVGSVKVTR